MNAPCTLSPRNYGISQYFDVSYLDFQRKGDKTTLKQNQVTPFSTILKKYQPTPNFLNEVKRLHFKYDLHRMVMAKNGKTIKELGTMSTNQVKTCKKAIECMINTIKFSKQKGLPKTTGQYTAFVTLSLPTKQLHSDKIMRKLQTRYIENLQKTYGVKYYVWKAETQKNGNIHFHILVDKWIHHTVHRKLWNKQLDKLGYLDEFQKIHGHRNPNSTDVHSLKHDKRGRKIGNITKYITKYMTKLEFGKRPIIGKIWGCSNATKKLDYPKYTEGDKFFHHIISMINKFDFKQVLKEEFFSYFTGKTFETMRKFYTQLWNDFKTQYQVQNGNTTLKKIKPQPFIRAEKNPKNATQFLADVSEKQKRIKERNRIQTNLEVLQKFKQNYIQAFGSIENQTELFTPV